jgi:hypothetical protein
MAYSMNGEFVITDKSLILDKTINKINQIGKELKEKTNVSLYICIKKKSLDKYIKIHTKLISEKIEDFYNQDSILISIALDITKMNILSTDKISYLVDEDKILNNYIVPFFVGHDKNSIESKYSAGLLNGYSQLAEDIADSRNIHLDSAIYSGSKDFFDAFRIFIYLTFLLIAILYIIRRFQRNKQ